MLVFVAARDEADHIVATVDALARVFPGAPIWVADDSSTDATASLARAAGAKVVVGMEIHAEAPCGAGECSGRAGEGSGRAGEGSGRCEGPGQRGRAAGKGQAMTLAVRSAVSASEMAFREGDAARVRARARTQSDLDIDCAATVRHGMTETAGPMPAMLVEPVIVLCDADLGESAAELGPLVDAIRSGNADLAVAAFSTRDGGGLGLALAFARWATRRRCGLALSAPLSGQRALRARVLSDVLPFASGFGMELAMTIDAVRAGHRVIEVELPLSHRATGRRLAGFVHRGRQLADFVRVYSSRR